MAGKLLVFYLGNDEAYFKTLQRDFKKYTRFDIDLRQLYESEESKIQSLFVEIYKLNPVLVFIDYSNSSQDYLHITRLITRTPLEKKIITVGLLDLLTPPEILEESISAGVDFAHIKQSDAFDVIFDISRSLSPQDKMQHGFATAKLKEEIYVGVPAKVGYIEQQGIHIETDYPLSKGDRVRLKTHLNDKKVFPSQEVFIQATSKSNLFYQFKQNADAQFLFVDEFIAPEGMDPDDLESKKLDRMDSIDRYKKELQKWIDDNLSRSLEKKAKVLVVDQDFTFYLDQKRTDKHPYTIRCVPFLSDMHGELDRLRPQVIAVSLEKPETPTTKNNVQMLLNLVGVLKAQFAELSPFIVIFNTETGSKEFQTLLSYDHVMATEAPFSVDVMVRMAEIFEKKMKKAQVIGVKDEEKVFIKKTNLASNAHIMISINITKISETDIFFESDAPFSENMNLKFSFPVNMYVNIVPIKGQGKVPEYHGLIHALGESDKMELRRFVNSVFFREHDQKLQSESAEFKKLNEKKLAERQEKEALDAAQPPEIDKKGA